MIFPEIVNYILTLRYPGSEGGNPNWIAYHGMVLIIVPVVASGQVIEYSLRPPSEVYAWLAYATKFGSDLLPNILTGTVQQYGTVPYSSIISQGLRDNEIEGFVLVTHREPMHFSVTNISPVTQRGEIYGSYLVIPTPEGLLTVFDALRRLHTSEKSEQLLQQVADSLSGVARPTQGGP